MCRASSTPVPAAERGHTRSYSLAIPFPLLGEPRKLRAPISPADASEERSCSRSFHAAEWFFGHARSRRSGTRRPRCGSQIAGGCPTARQHSETLGPPGEQDHRRVVS